MKHIKPIKSLGQNFLIDKNIALKTVNALEIKPDDYIFEIGPGEGSLTQLILAQTENLTVIEIDRRAVDLLKLKFNKLDIVFDDFLKIDFDKLVSKANQKQIKVIGNIPYYISSEIFFKLFENSDKISKVILTIQKELAQRLSAKQKTKEYGILTIAMQLCGKSKLLFDVSADCFYPKPNVTSAVIEFTFDNENFDAMYFKNIMKFIRASFNQRRKKLSNSLSSYFSNMNNGKEVFIAIKEHPIYSKFLDKRAEELTKDDFVDFFNFINDNQGKMNNENQ